MTNTKNYEKYANFEKLAIILFNRDNIVLFFILLLKRFIFDFNLITLTSSRFV